MATPPLPDSTIPKDASPERPKLPDFWYVAEQAKRDWFGKDVQETPTVSYVWTADQFGHFGLGFQITYLLGWFASLAGYGSKAVLLGLAGLNFTVWVVKEAFDYVREVKKSDAAQSAFRFNAREILWNVITALFYILTGVIVAGAAILGPWQPIVAFFLILVPWLIIAVWWLKRKIVFQQAGLPYLYRLATFPNEVGKEQAAFIESLSDPASASGRGKHLVITGPLGSGKSSLADGVGTEFAFKLGIGRYMTLFKLLESSVLKNGKPVDEPEFQDGRILWPWNSADLLIVDDVDAVSDVGRRIERVMIQRVAPQLVLPQGADDPVAQLESVLKAHLDQGFLKGLAARRSVWVLGDVPNPAAWRDMLAKLLGLASPNDMEIVALRMTVHEAFQAKAAKAGRPQKAAALEGVGRDLK